MTGERRKNSEIQISKISLSTTNERIVNTPEITREISEKIDIFLLLVKRYTHEGIIKKQNNTITSVNIFW